MAKKLKRAFTIVELVIVIAVIAILAAVLIPTFTTLIDKANQSADTSNVKNMNTILSMDETTNGKPKTMHDAVKVIREGGYDLEKLTPTGQGYDIVWDQDANRLLMVNGDEVIFGETEKNANEKHLWVVVDSAEKIAATGYSVYLTDVFEGTVTAEQGVDVGSNEDITKVTYNTAEEQNVKIRTNGGALVVNAAAATVAHYDAAASVDIQAVAKESYHEYGTVAGNITLKQGRFVAEDKSSAAAVIVTATDVNAVEIVINDTTKTWSIAAENDTVSKGLAGIVSGNKANAEIAENPVVSGFAGGVGTESSPYQIATTEQFFNISLFSNEMKSGKGYYFNLVADIQAPKETVDYFSGELNGDKGNGENYKIYISDECGGSYGTIFDSAYFGNVSFKNLDLVYTGTSAYSLCYFVGTKSNDYQASMENIVVYADNDQTMVTGYGYSAFCVQALGNIKFINCVSKIDCVVEEGGYRGIIIGNFIIANYANNIAFINCRNEGAVSTSYTGFFLANRNAITSITLVDSQAELINKTIGTAYIYVENCRNDGTMFGAVSCGAFGKTSGNADAVIDSLNAEIVESGKFYAGRMSRGSYSPEFVLEDKMVKVFPGDDVPVAAEYIVVYAVSTGFSAADGKSAGSSYFQVQIVLDSSLQTEYVSKIMLDTDYTGSLNSDDVREDVYGNQYYLVQGDDGFKTAVVVKESLINNFGNGSVDVTIGSLPRYSLQIRSDGQLVGQVDGLKEN